MISDSLGSGKGKVYVEGEHTERLDAGRRAEDVARELGISKHTIYAWKAKYGGMTVTEAREG